MVVEPKIVPEIELRDATSLDHWSFNPSVFVVSVPS